MDSIQKILHRRPDWRKAPIPDNTVVFAVGDIHGQDHMLKTLLEGIQQKVDALEPGVNVKVIFIGDYIDRGNDSPATVSMLQAFEQEFKKPPQKEVVFLSGNHDEYFKRMLEARELQMDGDDITTIPLFSLSRWLNKSGGMTTLQDYCGYGRNYVDHFRKRLKQCVEAYDKGEIDPEQEAILKEGNGILKALQKAVPEAHKNFFREIYNNAYYELGGFLFTHAGVDPYKGLQEQGLAPGGPELTPPQRIDRINIREPFLWRDSLGVCDKVVVHGHTHSTITMTLDSDRETYVADNQKAYRLGIDTGVYNPNGALTAMVRSNINGKNELGFMAVRKKSPAELAEYPISMLSPQHAQAQHARDYPQFHPGGAEYYGGYLTIDDEAKATLPYNRVYKAPENGALGII